MQFYSAYYDPRSESPALCNIDEIQMITLVIVNRMGLKRDIMTRDLRSQVLCNTNEIIRH